MDLEEQQGLIPQTILTKPIKQVRKVKYTKSTYFNYLIAILALIIIALMSYIVIDITDYEIMHLFFSSTIKQENTTNQIPSENEEQQQINPLDYTSKLDNLQWDDNNQEKVQIEDENFTSQNQINNEDNQIQTFQSATFEIGDEQDINNQQQIINDDEQQQLESYSFLQEGSNIIKPKIDDSKYNYVELPNKMKILLIQNDDENAQIYLNDFKGYCQTNYFVKCDQCIITVQEQQTQYFIQTKSDQILDTFNELTQNFVSESLQLKQINHQKSSWQELLSQISNPQHPLSIKYSKTSTFELSPNQLVLIVKGKFNSDELMDGIIQSDIVLLRDKDLQQIENVGIINQLESIIQWNNQQDVNSVKIIYELENSKELNFIDYFIQTSLSNYILNNNLGLDVKSNVILDLNNRQLYQIQITLPFQDDDKRKLAYKISNIIINFANSLEQQLLNNDNSLSDYCKQMIDQVQQINNLQFDYDNIEQNYMEIAQNLRQDVIEEVLHYKFMIQIQPKFLLKTLKQLQSTTNLIILINDSQYHIEDSYLQISKESQDQLNGISYSLQQITDQIKQFIEQTDNEIIFVFPQINNYIPQNLELVEQIKPFEINNQVEVFVDVTTKLPKIQADITIFTYGQLLYAEYLQERIIMEYQDAINVGYEVDTNQNQYFQLQFQGWSDHYTDIFKGIMEIIKEKPNEELRSQLQYKFDMLPEHLKLINFKIESILIANYKKPQFGVIGQNYKMKLTGNIQKDQAIKLNQILHKTLNARQKVKQEQLYIYSVKNKEIKYQIEAKDKWHLLINYYQFSNLNKNQQNILNIIQEFIQSKAQESHIIFEKKVIGCTQGFFLILQSSKQLESETEKFDKMIKLSLNELDKQESTKKQRYTQFWKKQSGKIIFYIDDQNRGTNMDSLETIQCK